jgi:hypothetical protein
MATKTWDGSDSGVFDLAANWVGGVAPVDGDDVIFDGDDVVVNKCTTGPAASIALKSIIARDAYGGECCWDNVAVTTLTIEDGSWVAGGLIATANLIGTTARVLKGTVTTMNASASEANAVSTIGAIAIGTANCSGQNARVASDGFSITVGIVNLTGLTARVSMLGAGIVTIGTVNMVNNTAEIRNPSNMTITTVNVYGATCEISALAIAAGKITNIYMLGRDQVLKDYDTNKVMVSTIYADGVGPGEF